MGKKLNIILIVMATCFLSACGETEQPAEQIEEQAVVQPTEQIAEQIAEQSSEAWQILFDGINTDQWRGYNTDAFPANWVIDGDALFYDSKATISKSGGNDLISKEQFGQFELMLEWKVAPGTNSGIFYHAVEDEKYENIYYSTVEMQVVDNEGHPDGKVMKHKAGDLYDMISSNVMAAKPVGEWNEVRIVVKDNNLEQWLNGQKIIETTMWDDNWNALIKNSKFADWPDFAQSKVGHIGLQDHGDPVWFRNIKIKKFD